MNVLRCAPHFRRVQLQNETNFKGVYEGASIKGIKTAGWRLTFRPEGELFQAFCVDGMLCVLLDLIIYFIQAGTYLPGTPTPTHPSSFYPLWGCMPRSSSSITFISSYCVALVFSHTEKD